MLNALIKFFDVVNPALDFTYRVLMIALAILLTSSTILVAYCFYVFYTTFFAG